MNPDVKLRPRIAQEALRESQALLKETEASGHIGGWVLDVETLTQTWTDEVFRILEIDLTQGEPQVPEGLSFVAPASRPMAEQAIQRARERGEPFDQEWEVITAKGNHRWVHAMARVHQEQGKTQRISGSFQDITRRKQAEQALHRVNAILQAAMDQSPAGIAIADAPDGALRYMNDAGLMIRGGDRERIVGGVGINQYVSSWQLLDLDGRPLRSEEVPLARAMAFGETCSREFIVRRSDNEDRIVLGNAAPIKDEAGEVVAGIVVFSDITERIQAEAEREKLLAQLIQAQKMEAVGQLAGGIAHDFNNLLQVILGQVDQALEDIPVGSPLHRSLTEVEKAGERAAELTRQLLGFGRRQVMQLVSLDMNELVNGMLGMLRRVLGEHLELCFIPGERLGMVEAIKGQFEQVLMNLCVNARDAMPDGGTLTIETEDVVVGKLFCEEHPFVVEGRYLLLSVTDTGCGMDEATRSQIFEPFFTTKAVGQGTGLGLSMVYGLVKQHGGSIEVYSEVGKGTCFKVYLPIVQRRAPDVGLQTRPRVVGGTETILVAEDEASVREVVTRFLESAGYTVIGARDGEDALRLFELHGDSIDLALLDVTMPKFGGREVMDRIVARGSRIRFLFSSGYCENVIHTNFVMKQCLHLIGKPHRKETLLRAVREALDADPS